MNDLQSALETLLPTPARVIDACSVSGGCISDAFYVAVDDGRSESNLFVKSNSAAFLDNFQCEADGLEQLARAQAIRVPQPLAVGLAAGKSWLISQKVVEGQRTANFEAKFAMQLARLHRDTCGDQIGASRDNYLGSSRQVNTPRSTWPDFVAHQRIEFQLRWAIDQHHCDPTFRRDCEQIIRSMPELLSGRDDQTSLLHGDLWSGNYLCDSAGDPVLIDPAVYRGCREAEFGMLKLFGSCTQTFYDAYQSAWPMPDGWQRRVNVYVLYHLINHLNLFGGDYLSQCRTMAAQILRSK